MPAQFEKFPPLFDGLSTEHANAICECMNARIKTYEKGECMLRAGSSTTRFAILLKGEVQFVFTDACGATSIIQTVHEGDPMMLALAINPDIVIDTDIVATKKSEILFLEALPAITPCQKHCGCHEAFMGNLLKAVTKRNISLIRRAVATSPKTIREKVLTYLTQESLSAGSNQFVIPFNQTQLAHYLGVDRSTLSTEFSKLRREGVIDFEGTAIKLLK